MTRVKLLGRPQTEDPGMHVTAALQTGLGRVAPPPAPTAVRVVVATERRTRERNEDAAGVAGWVLSADSAPPLDIRIPLDGPLPLLVAVVDGLGGHAAGHVAAGIAAGELTRPAILNAEAGPSAPPSLARLVAEAFTRADAIIHGRAVGPAVAMGCTAALLAIRAGGASAVGNVGDVRVCQVRDGYAGVLSVEDRPATDEGNPGMVTACLGGSYRHHIDPHVHELSLAVGDRLVLCSDGVHDELDNDAMGALAVGDAAYAARAIIAATEPGGQGDNATVAIVDAIA